MNVERDIWQLVHDTKLKISYQEQIKLLLEQNDHKLASKTVRTCYAIKNISVTITINEVPRQKSIQLWKKEIK